MSTSVGARPEFGAKFVPVQVLSARQLNRALLDRQLLLERATMPLETALEQVGGLQTQYAPSGYVGLWTRLAGFHRRALTEALEQRSVIQATLLRTTIHIVSRREFWLYAVGLRRARRAWALGLRGPHDDEATMAAAGDRLRAALTRGPRSVKELDGLADGFIGNVGLWVDLVRVPPSGTWERRRADRLALADQWIGPPEASDASEEQGIVHLVRAYLRGFGPAAWRDIQGWAGVPVAALKGAEESMSFVRYHDEAGRELIDLPELSLPDPDVPAPVRFLPHWDANLLVHARRSALLPEHYRERIFTSKNPFSVGTYLVDGRVAGAWSLRGGRVVLDPYEELAAGDVRAVETEREALEAFHA